MQHVGEAVLHPEAPNSSPDPVSPAAAAPVHPDRPAPPKLRFFIQAVLVGLLAGLVAVAFRGGLDRAVALRSELFHLAAGFGGLGMFLAAGVCALAVGASVWLVGAVAPEATGSGIPRVEAVLHHDRQLRWFRVLWVKFVGGIIGIGAGLALGREGPTVQMGAALGQTVGLVGHDPPGQRHLLIGLGACAGLAGAFNAPLASMAFLFEELREKFSPGVCLAALLATTSADVVCQAVLGPQPIFQVRPFDPLHLSHLPLFLLLGILVGVLGVLYNRTLLATVTAFDRLRTRVNASAVGLGVGALLGLGGWFLPELLGGGEVLAQRFILEEFGLGTALGLLCARFLVSIICYAVGAPGGLFAPILAVGAVAGLLFGLVCRLALPDFSIHPALFVLAGMAALFVGTIRKPLTGILLIMEMTGAFTLIVPILVACLAAYVTANALGDLPIYDELLQRDLRKGPELEQ